MPKNQQQTRNNHGEENQQNRQEKLPAENHIQHTNNEFITYCTTSWIPTLRFTSPRLSVL